MKKTAPLHVVIFHGCWNNTESQWAWKKHAPLHVYLTIKYCMFWLIIISEAICIMNDASETCLNGTAMESRLRQT